MSNETQETEGTETETARQWAVVQTGFIGSDSIPVTFKDEQGRVCPAIIKLCRDEQEARKMVKRLRTRHMRVEWFVDTTWHTTLPIYGVCATDLPAPKKRPGNPNAFGRGGSATESTEGKSGGRKRGTK